MKKTILSMAMLLTLSATVPALAQKHRHTPRTQMVDKQKDTKADAANAASQEDEGIEAYSDTTSTDNDSVSVTSMPGWKSHVVDDTNDLDPSRASAIRSHGSATCSRQRSEAFWAPSSS